MSYFNDLKNGELVAFVGKEGLSVLAKALEKVFAETDTSAQTLSKSLHLKSRCLMAWLDANDASFARIPLTLNITDTMITDHTVSLLEKNTAHINRREITKFSRRAEPIASLTDYSMPELAAQILTLPAFEDEVNGESPFQNIPELDKVIKSLVKRHLDFLKTSKKLQLSKSESGAECPDCGEYIRVSEVGVSTCICYKMFKNNSVHVERNDNGGLTVHFGKSWDQDNILLFTKALKNRIG